MGFQAAQHEVLAESFTKAIHKGIENMMKEMSVATSKNFNELTKKSEDHQRLQRNLERTKRKYQKSFLDWIEAKKNYIKSDRDPSVSRNEIAKLKRTSDSLGAQCEDLKGTYARELVKANKHQSEYYHKHLPGVINRLQNIEIDRIDFVKYALDQCVTAEKQVAHIIDKCREDMENAIQMIDPVADSDLLIDRSGVLIKELYVLIFVTVSFSFSFFFSG